MSAYLLSLAVGPVQEFIAAARRTHDLWFGSYLLSEISKAAALSLRTAGADLIFPAPDANLTPGGDVTVANKVLAELEEGLDPATLVVAAKAAAQRRWLEFAQDALDAAGPGVVREEIWRDQVEDVLEFYAAWAPLTGSYQECRTRVERLLAGRKALRDFQPAKGRARVPKSSLDGARESVFTEAVHQPERSDLRSRLRIKRGEQLDAVGLVKRRAVGSRKEKGGIQFVSVSRVAADAWLRGQLARPAGREVLAKIGRLCHEDFAAPVVGAAFEGFPFECAVLYESRLAELRTDPDLEACRPALTEIAELLRSDALQGAPSSYFAMLAADGDRMGQALATLASADAHRQFTRRLAGFAGKARQIVEANHGSLVYAGGDDVLAFLPLDTCLAAARQLHEAFAELLGGLAPQATLSVGLSIGHCLEPMEDLLAAAREAERVAKRGTGAQDERDGLAVSYSTRGSEPTVVRDQWRRAPDQRLQGWVDLFVADQLPDKIAYDLRALAREYKEWPQEPSLGETLRKDALRLLGKKRTRGERLSEERVSELLTLVEAPADLTRVADELVIARHIAAALRSARGQVAAKEVAEA